MEGMIENGVERSRGKSKGQSNGTFPWGKSCWAASVESAGVSAARMATGVHFTVCLLPAPERDLA